MERQENTRDGRRERAVKHRDAVVRALLELIRERGEVPSSVEVAKRASVSKRTVFRLFEDMDSLHHAAVQHQRAEVLRRFPPPMSQEGSIEERITALVTHRSLVYEHIMPLRKVAESLKPVSSAVAETLADDRDGFRAHVELLFASDLRGLDAADADDCLHAVELMTSWHAWRALREDQGCSEGAATRVLEAGLRRLLLGR